MINLKDVVVKEFVTPPSNNKVGSFVVEPTIGTIFYSYKKYKESKENIVILTANNFELHDIYTALSTLIDKKDLIAIPCEELLRIEYISSSKDVLSEEIYSLNELLSSKHKIIILPCGTVYKFYPSIDAFKNHSCKLKVGDDFGFEKLKEILINSGYARVNKIDQSLEFVVRGDIIDVFSINYDNPIRIEFFDNVIESIRFFDIGTQTSLSSIDSIDLLPSSLCLLSKNEFEKSKSKIDELLIKEREFFSPSDYQILKENIYDDLENFSKENCANKMYKYLEVLQDKHFSIFDYINNYSVIVQNEESFNNTKDILFSEGGKYINELNRNLKSLSTLNYYNKYVNYEENANEVIYLNNFFSKENYKKIDLTSSSLYSTKDFDLTQLLNLYLKEKKKILCLVDNKEQRQKIVNILGLLKVKYSFSTELKYDENKDVTINIFSFIKGFEYKNSNVVVLTPKELFGFRRHSSTYNSKFKQGVILSSYEDLEPGDYVVHEDYGIGRFLEIKNMTIRGTSEDYLQIEYADDQRLYIPLYQFNFVRKYVSKEGTVPRLNSLVSKRWESTKKRIKEKINILADRLLALYSQRNEVKGISFKKEPELEELFSAKFEHNLTKDQVIALDEIFKDMESSKPMERLLCGDVGFGKTEVAFRAAFRAILNNKFVIMIAPTTLLARQHYEVALKRFLDFDVKIALYTRMTSSSEAKLIEEGIRNREIHFLIGTHKALSRKIDLSNLGLLIIDEEQRFGVEQKEKIKEKVNNIDVLTLSATPIPRTLQSSLIGLKSVSTIETAPINRLAVQTYVIPYEESVVKELIKKELARHGQIFYVHNEVLTIYQKAKVLMDLVPECRIGVVHGQMNKNDVNRVMQEFYDGEIDLLLATSIIENGIDVENANLILIDNADHFGLSQLYQIKGRVGRGNRLAFAYLMINKNKEINPDASKRLTAIQDLSGLGNGYKIAQRDLLIRGAGDILGPEQAGFIDSVGIDMYIRLLNEAVEERKGNKVERKKNSFNISMNSFVPSSYIKDEEKVEFYQRILETNNFDSLNKLKERTIDIYGKMPSEVEQIFLKREIDLYLNFEEFESVSDYSDFSLIILSNKFSDISGIGSNLFVSLSPYIKNIRMSFIDKRINLRVMKNNEYINVLLNVLRIVHEIYIINLRVTELNENR